MSLLLRIERSLLVFLRAWARCAHRLVDQSDIPGIVAARLP